MTVRKLSPGTTNLLNKHIFIGAKSNSNNEQKIKGIIATEICHYAMQLVYQNNMMPFYQYDEENQDYFYDIAEEIIQNLNWNQEGIYFLFFTQFMANLLY